MKRLLVIVLVVLMGASASQAGLISHYSFDSENAGTTADAVGSAYATVGDKVEINATGGLVGGALQMNGGGVRNNDPSEGAVTSNSFSLGDSARTITFWWKAMSPNVNTREGAFVSFGDNAGAGTRFEVKEQSNTDLSVKGSLRVEVQGGGQNSTPADFDDGNWHFVAVVMSEGATLADVEWYVDGSATDLNESTSTVAIVTGAGPLAFGDSVVNDTRTTPVTDRVPVGFMDEFQLYDEVLAQDDLAYLYANPGCVVPEPATIAMLLVGSFGLIRRKK